MGAEHAKVGSALDLVEGLLEEIRGEEKRAETGDGSEPTTLPYKSVSNQTQKAQTGARAAENRSDVRKSLGEGGITGQEDANSAPNNSEKVQGEMKRLEADDKAPQSVGAYPPKPGDGSGPGDETYGSERKYGSLLAKNAAILEKLGMDGSCPSENATEKKNAETKTETSTPAGDTKEKKAAAQPAPAGGEEPSGKATEKTAEEKKAAEAELQKKAAAEKYREDAEAGYVAAQQIAHQLGVGMSKAAEEEKAAEQTKLAQEKIEAIQKAAEADAQLFVDFMKGHLDGQKIQKKAQPMPPMPPDAAGGMPPEAGAEMPPEAPPEEMPPEAGGEPGEGGAEDQLEAVAAALEEAGITPEELAEAIAAVEQAQGGGEGVPAEAAAAAPAE
jgi:hypothetical protein